jgi:threonine aldolase
MLGGGMRQVGVLAAAGMVALDTMIDRLADDHANARKLANALANIHGLKLDPETVQTNIVIFQVDPSLATAQELIGALDREGVKVGSPGKGLIRMVTHRQITGEDVDEALVRISRAVKGLK